MSSQSRLGCCVADPLRASRRSGSALAGFTLIELLVVVVIIAVLLSILLPAIDLVRRSARQAVCASNLRQTSMALMTYSQDFRRLPPAVNSNNWSFGNMSSTALDGGSPTAAAAVFYEDLVDTPRVFYCPAASVATVEWWNGGNPDRLLPANLEYCYIGYCWWAGYTFALGPTPPGLVARRWGTSSEVLLSDMTFPSQAGFPTGSHLDDAGATPLGGNVLYGDGHVAWLPFASMSMRQFYYMPFYF